MKIGWYISALADTLREIWSEIKWSGESVFALSLGPFAPGSHLQMMREFNALMIVQHELPRIRSVNG